MLIRWLTIFLPLADFILIDSDGLSVNNTERSSLSKFDDSETSIEAQKIPTLLNHQETTWQEENRGVSSRRTNYLIAALSKIAKIRSSEEDPASIGRDLTTTAYNARESTYFRNGVSVKDAGALLDTELSSELSSNISDNLSGDEIGRENFHCRAIRDIYIPEIKENIPSYACTTGSKTFILSSKRFFQDRRSSLHINIDDDTLRELNDPAITPASSRFNVIPAVLILQPGHENYDIRNQQSLREQQIIDNKNIE